MQIPGFYLNYLSLGSLVPGVFFILLSLFLFSLRNRSSASFHLAMVYLYFSFIPLNYFLNFSFYDPAFVTTRWVSAVAAIPSAFHVIQFFYHYPVIKSPLAARFFLYLGYVFTGFIWAFYIYTTKDAKVNYDFTGHYYDFQLETVHRITGVCVFVSWFLSVIVGLWRVIVTRGRDRWIVLSLLFSFLIITAIPAATNLLSRGGYISRGNFYNYFSIFMVVGTFFLSVLYINSTKDKIPLLTKITGMSLVTFFLLFEAVAYFSFLSEEDAFDQILGREAFISWIAPERSLASYTKLYSVEEARFIEEKGNISPDLKENRVEFLNAYYLKKIKELENKDNNYKKNILELLEIAPYYFSFYKLSLIDYISHTESRKNLAESIIEYLENLDRSLEARRKLIRLIPAESFRSELKKISEGADDPCLCFSKTIQAHLASSKSEGELLRIEILRYLAPLRLEGDRFYRSVGIDKHFVSYFLVNTSDKKVFEAGFEYRVYREFIHQLGFKYFIFFFVGILFILVGYEIFFYKTLVVPMRELMRGLALVKKGKDAKIPVHVEDELGTLAKSFNRMSMSLKGAKLRLEEHAKELENRIIERTSELSTTLEEIQNLKTGQDGDYFLTSLLLKPLGKNHSSSKKVNVEFLVSQKKKFQFRYYKEEIGGDICISYDIHLKDRNYVVFINADAMGKSMQGAGGALVIGSVFQSIIERTSSSSIASDIYPERWLKNTFIELHKVFESFKGSMLVSAVFGLLDERNGFLYYINAEHPHVILYRDGKASFIDHDMAYRKLGTLERKGKMTVGTHRLYPGDTLIVGSDGKDDIFFGRDENGNRIINHDENWILARVEEGNGNLKEIYSAISKHGELTDDISLLKLEYKSNAEEYIIDLDKSDIMQRFQEAKLAKQKGNWEEAVALLKGAHNWDEKNRYIAKLLIDLLIKLERYSEAADVCENLTEHYSWETRYLFLESYCLKKTRKYKKAADVGERVRMRESGNLQNLLNLSEIYIHLRDLNRAEIICGEFLNLDPENRRGLELKKRLGRLKQLR